MGQSDYTSTDVEVSTEKEADGLTKIGAFTICANGLGGGYRHDEPRQPVCRGQVEIVKEFLRECRPTRWARNLLSPVSSDLKHWVEKCAGLERFQACGQGSAYISTGAAIIAAIELGFACIPTGEASRNVFIGVHFDDVAARMAERGWHIERGHEGATRILPSSQAHWDDGNGVELFDMDRRKKPSLLEIVGDDLPDPDDLPPMFWVEIADALGLSEAEEG